MSSILRALKKLENDPRHQKENQPPLANKFVVLADTAPQRSFSNTILITVGAGIICSLVFFAAWWLFSENNQAPPATSPEIAIQASMPQQTPPEPAVSETFSVPPPDTPPVRITADPVSEPEPLSLPEPAFQAITEEETEQIEQPAETFAAQAPEALNRRTAEKNMLQAGNEISASPGMAHPGRQEENIDIPPLNDPEMKLQAVTWSKEPQKRIAVINNRILREGDMVLGYYIAAINQDDVDISREGKKWKLSFRIK